MAASRSPKDLKKPRDLFMLMFVLLLKAIVMNLPILGGLFQVYIGALRILKEKRYTIPVRKFLPFNLVSHLIQVLDLFDEFWLFLMFELLLDYFELVS